MSTIISNQNQRDLEFDKLRDLVADYCETNTAAEIVRDLSPMTNVKSLEFELMCVKEYVESFEEITIPGIQSGEIKTELKRLQIDDVVLEAEQFMNIAALSRGINRLIVFFQKNEELYPTLAKRIAHLEQSNEIVKLIESVLDRHGSVKSSASQTLSQIRKSLQSVRKSAEREFQIALSRYRNAGFLDDTKETYINGKRALAVPAEHKRKIKGMILGSSNSGKIAFIEPQSAIPHNNELAMLKQEEQDEIYRILRQLTNDIKVHIPVLEAYQHVLVDMDFVQAKAHFSKRINGILPELHPNQLHINFQKCLHPLLWLKNEEKKEKTISQNITLDKEKRILVISGPNAGGKSISLKTVGLLQTMLQSGLLIPVEEGSSCGIFGQILTDIGDNQSIENELSTYSYRLKNMYHFLTVTNKKTLFLIDEFGTGSDPELGGALAEVCFEALYKTGAYGVITTHYANIKIIADQLEAAQNGSMLFDRKTLMPLYKLSVGQPGSSFTFEVAEKNKIPKEIIKEARSRVHSGKLDLDESIGTLQREKLVLTEKKEELQSKIEKTKRSKEDFEFRREELEFKLLRLQQTQQENNDFINFGKKLKGFIDSYNGKNLKKVIKDFVKFLKIEYTKNQKPEQHKEKQKKKLAPIEKQREKSDLIKPKKRKYQKIEVGDKVVIEGGSQKGEVVDIEGKRATVLFGNFKTTADLKKLHQA
jgi:DNA mismatch repair protein MutS2